MNYVLSLILTAIPIFDVDNLKSARGNLVVTSTQQILTAHDQKNQPSTSKHLLVTVLGCEDVQVLYSFTSGTGGEP